MTTESRAARFAVISKKLRDMTLLAVEHPPLYCDLADLANEAKQELVLLVGDPESEITLLAKENARLRTCCETINDIRNEIIGYQAINWSAHIYPLVKALEDAGYRSEEYEMSRAKAKRQCERIAELEAKVAELEAKVAELTAETPTKSGEGTGTSNE
jgi:hypothetical protein